MEKNIVTETELDKLETWSFEVYTKNPETGEEGWDIKFVRAFGETRKEAIAWLKNTMPHFDCIITMTASDNGCYLNNEDIAVYASGRNWYYTDSTEVN